jgi:NADPH:quinone reductase
MRAIEVRKFGGPEVLEWREVPDPQAGNGEVVVAVEIVDTGFVETQIRRGLAREWFPHRPPFVPGGAVGGRVRQVGAGVDRHLVGRKVVAVTGGSGGYAEQVVVAVEGVVPVPDGLDLADAVAVVHDGTTALGLSETTGIHAGEHVLITAAGGGMGLLLVQLAHAAGAYVVAAARGRRKLDLALRLGAHAAVDYAEDGWTDAVLAATDGKGPDVVFDGAGGQLGRAAFEITRQGGRFSAHGAPSGGFTVVDAAEAKRRDITVRGIEQVRFEPDEIRRLADAVSRAIGAAAARTMRPVIGQTFPLERARDAHAAIEARAVVGKTLLLA